MQVVGARQLREGASPAWPRTAVLALAAVLVTTATVLCVLAPGLRLLGHLLVVLAAVAVAALGRRSHGLAVGVAAATAVALGGVLATDDPTAAQWLLESAAVAIAAVVVVLLQPGAMERTTGPPRPGAGSDDEAADGAVEAGVRAPDDSVDDAVVAFADTGASGSVEAAVAAGLGVVLPSAELVAVQVGSGREQRDDVVGLVVAEAVASGNRALLPAGFSGEERDVVVGFPVRHGDNDVGAVVLVVATDTSDQHLERVEAYLRRVAPTLAAHATAEVWAELDPGGGRSTGRDGELAAMLSRAAHDLRVPLGSLTGAVETLMTHDEALGHDGREDVYEILQRSTRRVSEWIGVLLEQSLDPARTVPRTRPVELGPLLAEAAENARAATAGLDVTVLEVDALVEADPGLVIRVLTNLLANAGHHAADGGAVEVHTVERGDRVQVRVVDHGPGIDPEDLASRSTDEGGGDGPGLGIGLDSARSLVQSWGGQFGIGRTPGGGATVWFTLPLTSGRAATPDTATAGEPTAAGQSDTDGGREAAASDGDGTRRPTTTSPDIARLLAASPAGQVHSQDGDGRHRPSDDGRHRPSGDGRHRPSDDGQRHADDAVAGDGRAASTTDGADGDLDKDEDTAPTRRSVSVSARADGDRGARVRWTVAGPEVGPLPTGFRGRRPRP